MYSRMQTYSTEQASREISKGRAHIHNSFLLVSTQASASLSHVRSIGRVIVGHGGGTVRAAGGGHGRSELVHNIRGLIDLGAREDSGDLGGLLHGQDRLVVLVPAVMPPP